ncbi:MAG: chemotaxis protein CheW [Sphingomonadales bacterium]
MDDLLNEFLTETAESIDVVDVEVVKLERDPTNKGVLDNIFRLVHTIKGTCGFLGLPRLEAVAHASENVLGKFRDGELEVTPAAVSLILMSLDRIKEILAGLARTETEPEGDDSDLIAHLDATANGVVVAAPEPDFKVEPVADSNGSEDRAGVTLDELEAAFLAAPGPDELAQMEAEKPSPAEPVKADDKPDQSSDNAHANQTIRVNVDLLEDLMNMVSELVLTRNQLMQILRRQSDSEFAAPLQRLSQCTTELQEGVMKTRMQSIGNAWTKLPRIVRDLCLDLNKKIDLQMAGADTELDRQVLELIKDPLTHMVRNSADHGIEVPTDRAACGKPETGVIHLNAYHEGGHIIIQIRDDGAGLKAEKLKAKALANGLATEAELAEMSEQQIQKFILHPGFSTADKVTNVSGRGVGMDVVRSNIEKIGGTIDLKSTEGKGSTFTIKIPLTLAIVSALIVQSGSERFAIPQINVLELVSASGNSEHKIEHINDTPVLRLRDRLLPLVKLANVLGVSGSEPGSENPGDEVDVDDFIIVTQVGAFSFGIVVDQVYDTEEIVVKPVSPVLRHLSVYSGNTILGDGSVIMILDPNGIATEAGDVMAAADVEAAAHARSTVIEEDRESMLLFRAGDGAQRAVPLELVARLEEVDVETIERSDGKLLVQYRGQLMPLIVIDGETAIRDTGRQPVLVFADRDRTMGLVVEEIIDIVEEKLDVELTSGEPGILGTAVVARRATEIIDVSWFVRQAFRDWLSSANARGDGAGADRSILMVDDSAFFRNMLKPLLSTAGYKVTSVETAAEAITLRDSGAEFDIIVSDIEMPGIDGFEFARLVREDGNWRDTPLVALSAHARPQDFERGRAVGFNDYVAKFDRDALLASLSSQLTVQGEAA